MLFLRILGIAMLFPSWSLVFSSRAAFHGRRGSRIPMSLGSKLAGAMLATAFCLGTFGAPRLCMGVAAISMPLWLWYLNQDRRKYEKQLGRLSFRPTGGPEWAAFFALDLVFLVLFLFFVIRDQIWPPVTQEQRIVHYLGWGFVAFTAIAALLLYWKRPRRNTSEN